MRSYLKAMWILSCLPFGLMGLEGGLPPAVVIPPEVKAQVQATLAAPSPAKPTPSTGRPPAVGTVPVAGEPLKVGLDNWTAAVPTSEVDIARCRVFVEALVPMGTTTDEENADLGRALASYISQTDRSDLSVMQEFLDRHPASAWTAALQVNLGLADRQNGRYSRAIRRFQTAWEVGLSSANPDIAMLVDRAIGEYALLMAWVGRYEELDSLANVVGTRHVRGVGGEKYRSARMGRLAMGSAPESSFKCGPYALESIQRLTNPGHTIDAVVAAFPSTTQGTSLRQVLELATQIGLSMQPARRLPGAELMAPAVLHWRLGHFSALLRVDGNRALIQDRTMDVFEGQTRWIPVAAIEEESSGAFLVPAGPLKAGWTSIAHDEAETIWGKGDTGPTGDPRAFTNCDEKRSSGAQDCHGMAVYNLHLLLTSLNIQDEPLAYNPPYGPSVGLRLSYNEKDSLQPAVFTMTNFGPKWTCNWIWYVVDDAMNTNGTQNIEMYVAGGGGYQYQMVSGVSVSQPFTGKRLSKTGPAQYELRDSDGNRWVFAQSDGGLGAGRRIYLSQMIDPLGHALELSYELAGNGMRLVTITDASGQVTTLNYRADDPLKVEKATDPFGRTALFAYNSGRLASITDPVGMVSSFAYEGTGDIITALTTPYGTTSFRRGTGTNYQRWIEAVDPHGDVERVEYMAHAPGVSFSDPTGIVPARQPGDIPWFNEYMVYRNSFYWDKKAMRKAPGDYTKATIYHWLHGRESTGWGTSRLVESVKEPLTNRVWFLYPGQTWAAGEDGITVASPIVAAMVLDDGTTQRMRATFSASGQTLSATDSLGRTTHYVRDSGGNVTEVRQSVDNSTFATLAAAAYNGYHQPMWIMDAAGNRTDFGYDTSHRLIDVTDAAGRTTALSYDDNGRLAQVATGGDQGLRQQYAYDSLGRVRTVTDADGYTITIDYDQLHRPVVITYPDGTYEQVVWNRLDAERRRDRMGRWSYTWHNALRQVVATRDEAGRMNFLGWCRCGALQDLWDGDGNQTHWEYDLMGRVTAKRYADGTQWSWAYHPMSGRLASQTDPKGQVTAYTYMQDGKLASIAYQAGSVPTPGVSFSYDPVFGRMTTMTDGTGTTTYDYYPFSSLGADGNLLEKRLGAGMLRAVIGPIPQQSETWTYDTLMRPVTYRLGNGITEVVGYDALGRLQALTNALGTFSASYVGATGRMESFLFPQGMKAEYTYGPVAQGSRLTGIRYKRSAVGPELTSHGYETDVLGQITSWSTAHDGQSAAQWRYEYDPASQLAAAVRTAGSGLLPQQQAFSYDVRGNRTALHVGNAVTSHSANAVNQLISAAPGGVMRIMGRIDEPGTVTINGAPARMGADFTFTGTAEVQPGQNSIAIVASDLNGNTRSTQWQAVDIHGDAWARSYDLNGNLTNDGVRTYTWDAADRLVEISSGTGANIQRTQFVYNGRGQRVRVIESMSGTITSDRLLIWSGSRLVEEREAAQPDTLRVRYFAHGVIRDGVVALVTRDHLGNVRDVIRASDGHLLVRLDWDPYGNRTEVTGDAAWGEGQGFTGHWRHAATELDFAWFRAYDPATGRWLSRDPLGEMGGINLYAYGPNSPINGFDPDGLAWYNDWGDFLNSPVMMTVVNPTTANFGAGFGDAATLGATRVVRNMTPGANSVNPCSGAYSAGEWTGIAATAIGGGFAARSAAGGFGNIMRYELGQKWLPQLVANEARAASRLASWGSKSAVERGDIIWRAAGGNPFKAFLPRLKDVFAPMAPNALRTGPTPLSGTAVWLGLEGGYVGANAAIGCGK